MRQGLARTLTNAITDPPSETVDRRWLLVTMCLAVLLAQVDTSVVNLAVHAIGTGLNASVNNLQWVLDGYNLAYAVLLLTGGLLCDLYGRRRLFLLGAAVFTGGSALCAGAPDLLLLIAGRAIAGAGAALLLPASLAIIRVEWHDETERNHALGVWAACNGLAFVIGPTLGGFLVQGFGWRSVFLIAVPLGLAAIALAMCAIPKSSDPAGRRFDAMGQIWGAVAVGGLAVAGIDASRTPLTAAVALVAAAMAVLLFLRVERRRGDAAMMPVSLFSSRRFDSALIATATMTFGMYGVLFLVPMVWQASGTLSASLAGLALVPMASVFFMVSNFSGRLVAYVGARGMIAGGTAIISLGLFTLSATAAGRPLPLAELGLVLTGLGMGCNTAPLFGVAVGSVPKERSGSASSLINVARMVGATLGVAILGSTFALVGGGASGLRGAMLLGGAMQLVGAGVAWRAIR